MSLMVLLFVFIYKRRAFLNLFLAYFSSFIAVFLVLFVKYFNNFQNFYDWTVSSLSVAQGYSSAMSSVGPIFFTALAFLIITFYIKLLSDFYKKILNFLSAACFWCLLCFLLLNTAL